MSLDCFYRPLMEYNYANRSQIFTFMFDRGVDDSCRYYLDQIRADINTTYRIPYDNIRFAIPASWMYLPAGNLRASLGAAAAGGFEPSAVNIILISVLVVCGLCVVAMLIYVLYSQIRSRCL